MKKQTTQTVQVIFRSFFTLLTLVIFSSETSFAQNDTNSSSSREVIMELPDSKYTAEEIEKKFNERNKVKRPLEISVGLQGSLLQANDSWITTSGGTNAITLLSSVKLSHTYAQKNFRLESKVNAIFGYNRIDTDITEGGETYNKPIWYKNQDEFSVYLYPSYKLSEKWSYGASIGFRTQFALGYVSRAQQESIHALSGFMAPGYLDVSGGFVWTDIKESMLLTVRLSPISMSAIYVCNEDIRSNFVYQFSNHEEDNFLYTDPYGVYYQDTSKYEGGSSIQVDFEYSFDKKNITTFKSSLYSFYGWFTQVTYDNIYRDVDEYNAAAIEWNTGEVSGSRPMLSIMPTVRWENTLNVKMTKVLTTTIEHKLYFNRAQDLGIQTQTMVNVGLTYTFSNQKTDSDKKK